MGLFSTDGTYDLNIALISKGEEAISWGNRLFDHYMQKATPVKIGSEEIQDEIVVME